MRKTDETIKLEERLVAYLRARASEMGAQYAWVSSRIFMEVFEEIKSRNSARRILRQCKDIVECRHPRNKRQYMYGLPGWPKPTKTSVAAYI